MTRAVTPTGDRGSATVWVVALTALVLLASVAGVARAAAVIARHRADSAADLAALAAAARVLDGGEAACRAAADIAERNGAALRSCRITGQVVQVDVGVVIELGPLGDRRAGARARAGPATWTVESECPSRDVRCVTRHSPRSRTTRADSGG